FLCLFFFSSRRRHTRFSRDWSSDVCSSDLTCVSWEDASAYATWAGRRDGVDYRLATASEWVRLPAAGGERRMAEWNIDCSGDCAHRVTSGASWRSDAAGPAAREADRGYDDVGFRLVRDLGRGG